LEEEEGEGEEEVMYDGRYDQQYGLQYGMRLEEEYGADGIEIERWGRGQGLGRGEAG
jgi:hypothetical protein